MSLELFPARALFKNCRLPLKQTVCKILVILKFRIYYVYNSTRLGFIDGHMNNTVFVVLPQNPKTKLFFHILIAGLTRLICLISKTQE